MTIEKLSKDEIEELKLVLQFNFRQCLEKNDVAVRYVEFAEEKHNQLTLAATTETEMKWDEHAEKILLQFWHSKLNQWICKQLNLMPNVCVYKTNKLSIRLVKLIHESELQYD